MEGGAQVVIEAITAHTAVIASRIDGNMGLLGRDYPGLFKVGDAAGAARLVERAITEPAFMRRLVRACEGRAPRFAPAREAAAVNRLVDNALAYRSRNRR
jgi:glycosyltransferase involved in cell wall biosynthesis